MRIARIASSLLLLSLTLGGTAWPYGEEGAAAGTRGGPVEGVFATEPGRAPASCACADLAFTETFRSRDLGYVRTREFTEALRAVAGGESGYSPPEIPRGWTSAAASWGSDAGPGDPGSCSPVLVYLASLEYRARRGDERLVPAFPAVVRDASGELQARVAAKRRMAPAYEQRAAAIGAKLSEAERMGARECQPSELARVKEALDAARRAAREIRFDPGQAEDALARADRSAESLLARRQYAARSGMRCLPE